MLTILIATAALVVLFGHGALWISFWNHVQGTAMPLWMNTVLSHVAKACFIGLPLAANWIWFATHGELTTIIGLGVYGTICFVSGLIYIPSAIVRRQRRRFITKLRAITSKVTTSTAAREQSLSEADWPNWMFLRFPGNQSFELEVNEKRIEIPRLPAKLDGLSIAHISDLHFTGKIAKTFFNQAIDEVNGMDADIVAVTGDILDAKECLDWIPATLGRLKAKHGVYVILGNHDTKQNLPNLRQKLSEFGLENLGGRLQRLSINGEIVILAGNELPWITPAADMCDCPTRDAMQQTRILLAHTPDQLNWAQFHDFDLMLAGHTHGGQFCIPGFGPVFCPSRFPLEFASGTIYEAPTVLHVSRGLSGEIPFRLNCRPEITCLRLQCATGRQEQRSVTQADENDSDFIETVSPTFSTSEPELQLVE